MSFGERLKYAARPLSVAALCVVALILLFGWKLTGMAILAGGIVMLGSDAVLNALAILSDDDDDDDVDPTATAPTTAAGYAMVGELH